MRKIDFVKYEALGNSYIVIDPSHSGLTEPDPQWIRRLCDTNHGIGSDGVLWGPVPLSRADVPGLRIFNSDGSEAEKSGNGLRIFARYLKDSGRVSETFSIESSAGVINGKFLNSGLIEIEMGQARLVGTRVSEELRVDSQSFEVTLVNVGNPHCVVFAGFEATSQIREWGPRIETHPRFPQRTNVQFVRVVSRDEVFAEIWERGSAYTQASGSSSCAVAFACFKRGLVDSRLRVKMPGGHLEIEVMDLETLKMTGPVAWIANGQCCAPLPADC
jgi:diaminopimelate epimerase